MTRQLTQWEILTSHLGAGILVGALYLGWLLRTLSRRIGEVNRMPPYYRGFDVANGLVLIAILSYILQCSAALPQQPVFILDTAFAFLTFYVPLTIGMGLSLATALIYWGWLIKQT